MMHNDPNLYIEYSAIAEQLEQIRLRGTKLAQELPASMLQSAGMLSYHLRQAFNEAQQLAGERPEEVKARTV